jgi:hypothetical protein
MEDRFGSTDVILIARHGGAQQHFYTVQLSDLVSATGDAKFMQGTTQLMQLMGREKSNR